MNIFLKYVDIFKSALYVNVKYFFVIVSYHNYHVSDKNIAECQKVEFGGHFEKRPLARVPHTSSRLDPTILVQHPLNRLPT